MLKKTISGISFAEAAKSKTQAMTHELVTPLPFWQASNYRAQQMIQTEQTFTDGTCFPGVAKMYSTYEEAEASWMGSEGEIYTDSSFTGWGSLYEDWQDDSNAINWEFDGYERVQDLDDAGSEFSLWGPYGIRPEGVNQGTLGDCWFLAAASSLAEVGSRVLDVFSGRGKQSNGFYILKFYVMGEPKYITVDDTVPTNSYGRTMMSHRSDEGAWWVPILEKAYAKFNFNYAALKSGASTEAFADMTGMPVQTFFIGCENWEEQKILDLVRKAEEKGYMVTGSTNYGYYGLVYSHAYTILGISDETYEGEGGEETMINLRNPWSREEYYGPGSDQEDDGKFSMPLSSFKEGIYEIDVLYYADWKWTSTGPLSWGDSWFKAFEFQVDQKQDIAIQVEIPSQRQMGSDPSCNQWFAEDGTGVEITFQIEAVYDGWTQTVCSDRHCAVQYFGGASNRAALVFDDGPSNFQQLEEGTYVIYLMDYYQMAPQGAEYAIRTFGMESEIHLKQQVIDDEGLPEMIQKTSSRDSDYVEDTGTIVGDCVNDPYYTDVFGDSCSAYEGWTVFANYTVNNRERCGKYDAAQGYSSSDFSCCACGGGSYLPPEYGNSWDEPDCVDSTTATDQYGSKCLWYTNFPDSCGQYDTDTFKANYDCMFSCGTC